MSNYSRGDVVLVRYPFSNLSGSKIRPAVIVSSPHESRDFLMMPLTSRVDHLLSGEFVISDWKECGLNVPSAAKRGVYTIQGNLVIKCVGRLSKRDFERIESSLKAWLGLH